MISLLTVVSTVALSVPPPPFGAGRHPVTRELRGAAPVPREVPTGDFLGVAYRFYRTVVTPIDGPRCAHRPTCSAYARQAVNRHGLVGLWLAYDRLLRGSRSSAVRPLPVALEQGHLVLLDPVEESAFWLP